MHAFVCRNQSPALPACHVSSLRLMVGFPEFSPPKVIYGGSIRVHTRVKVAHDHT
jgi:hypothetical protein